MIYNGWTTEKSGPIKRFKFEKRDGSIVIVSACNVQEAENLAGKGSKLLTITKQNYHV